MMVLCYHKICDASKDWDGVITSRNTFISQLEYLKTRFRFVSIEEALKNPSPDTIVLTFDDGAEDNYTIAYPIIKEYEIPTIFFVMSETLDKKSENWINELIWLLMECGTNNSSLELMIDKKYYSFDTSTLLNREYVYKELIKILIGSTIDIRNATMSKLQEWGDYSLQEKRTSHLMLSADELSSFAQSSFVTIGAHTVTHRSLGLLSDEEQYNEIKSSKDKIEKLIGQKIELFAYPFGGPTDYTMKTIDILKSVGIKYAFSTTYKRKNKYFSEYEIPRVCINESSMDDFKAKIDLYTKKESYYYNVAGITDI